MIGNASFANRTSTKKADPARPAQRTFLSLLAASLQILHLAHACGELLLGEATGGHGLPGVGFIPELLGDVPPLLLLWLLPVPGFDGFELEPGFELDDPEFGVVPGVPFVAPGSVPQGEPLGELPGLFGVLGLMVDGCVVPPGVGVAGEFDPGTVVFGVPLGEEDPGEF